MFCSFRVVTLLFGIVCCSCFASAQLIFNQVAVNSGDTSSNSIVSGDFQREDVLDLVTLNNSSLTFYRNLGGGKFAASAKQNLLVRYGEAVSADLNRDGKLDLAAVPVGGEDGGILILLGRGDGTFAQGTNLNVGGTAMSIALADFNGDHLPDIAVSVCNTATGCSTPATKIYLGTGNGTFSLSASLGYGDGKVVTGDFNADGHQDIVVVTGGNIAMYLGNGNGTFKSPLLSTFDDVSSIAVGDFYNNRIQSLAILGGDFIGGGDFTDYVCSLRYSNGQLLVSNKQELGVTGDPYYRLAAGDLDGDFKDDIILAGGNVTGGGASAYMLGNGDGTFRSLTSTPHMGDLLDTPFIADLNGDSRHDIVFSWTSIFDSIGGADVLFNTNGVTNCSLPPAGALAVHICTPTPNQTVGKSFTFRASGNVVNGIAKRMELWIDGKKVAQNLEDQLNATAALTRGKHVATFVVVDSFDSYVKGSLSFTSSY